MAYINFKPVCECGHIFKNFIYTPPQQESDDAMIAFMDCIVLIVVSVLLISLFQYLLVMAR